MSDPLRTPGRFVWYELLTDSVEASMLFYQGLCGWRFVINRVGSLRYRLILNDDQPVGGLIPLTVTAAQEIPAHWLPYVTVPNVDLAAYAAIKGEGRVLAPPRELEPVGRFAVVEDPAGAQLALWRSSIGDPPEVSPAPRSLCWSQLDAPDPDAVLPFYEKVLSWQRAPVPRAPAGADAPEAWMLTRNGHQRATLVRTADASRARWLTHLCVLDLSEARRLTEELGGQVLREEIAVPGYGRYTVIEDNVGAALALFEPA